MHRSLLSLVTVLLSSAIIAHTQDADQQTNADQLPNNATSTNPMCGAFTRSTTDEIHHVGGGVSPPQVFKKVDPEYPKAARKARIEGRSELNLVVDKDGVPRDICIQRSLRDDLDRNAIRAVSQWRFEPSRLDGRPVAVPITVLVDFRLNGHQGSSARGLKANPVSQSH